MCVVSSPVPEDGNTPQEGLSTSEGWGLIGHGVILALLATIRSGTDRPSEMMCLQFPFCQRGVLWPGYALV